MNHIELNEADFIAAAATLACDVAALRAVAEVESRGAGFNDDGSIKILFEGHHFSRLTHHKFDVSHPTISYPKWTREFYAKSQAGEQLRLITARGLDENAALLSTSWGRFQIMGFNFAVCDFATVDAFVDAMLSGERAQLDAFIAYIEARNLDDELREHRWADFARLYNGPGYAENQYDTKMAAAHERFTGEG